MITIQRTSGLALAAGLVLLAGCSGTPMASPTTVTLDAPDTGGATGDVAPGTASPSAPATGATSAPKTAPTSAGRGPGAPTQSAGPTQVPAPRPTSTPTSAEVAAVQRALVAKGYLAAVTGTKDAATVAAITRYQREHGLSVDGVAGPSFWASIRGGADRSPSPTPPPAARTPTLTCSDYRARWEAAVRRGSSSAAGAAHEAASAIGCRPNTWVSPHDTPRHEPGQHAQGDPCAMSELGVSDDAGLVCTQDVEGSPHWN